MYSSYILKLYGLFILATSFKVCSSYMKSIFSYVNIIVRCTSLLIMTSWQEFLKHLNTRFLGDLNSDELNKKS